jgi:hypothetical protein
MKTLLSKFFVVLCAFSMIGCVTVKEGSDPLVVRAEQLAKEATDTLDEFIKFVDRNQAVAGKDLIAAREIAANDGPVYIRELRKWTKLYKANRLPDSRATLEEKVNALQRLLDLVREQATEKTKEV